MANNFDCSKYVPHECKAFCCGPTPIPTDVYKNNLHRRQREVKREDNLGDHIFPDTETQYCTFLSEDYVCQIYEDRPEVCQQFGKSNSPLLQCPFMDTNGCARTPENRKKVEQDFYDALSLLG